ncbi:MAG: arsinothricin resistance N-acetyltransferase ArsN1 family B [Pseudomonadota bacterium]
MRIRQAEPQDAVGLLAIYAPVVLQSPASFELTPPSPEEFGARIASARQSHEWLVMEDGQRLCGYAYATPHRAREAYQHSVETSVYVDPDYQGRGVGRNLYTALFESLQGRGFHNAFAGITEPNAASVALHKSVGFEFVGVFREIGYKYDQWHDVSWWQRGVEE